MKSFLTSLLLGSTLCLVVANGLRAAEAVLFVQPTNAVPVAAPVDGSNYLQFNCAVGCSSSSPAGANNADAVASVATGLTPTQTFLFGYNGATWDRLQLDASKYLKINCVTGCAGGSFNNNADTVATSATNGQSASWPYLWNGATWDRWYGDKTNGAFVNIKSAVSLAVTGTFWQATQPVSGMFWQATQPVSLASLPALAAGGALIGKVGIDQTTDGSTNAVTMKPTATAGAGITPVSSTAAESNKVLKAGAGNFYSAYITTGAAAGYFMIANSPTAPTAGGAAIAPVHCIQVAANSSASISTRGGPPDVFANGITAVFSTTGCFTNTASATAFFSGDVQ